MTIDLRFHDQLAQVTTRGGRLVRYAVWGRDVLCAAMSGCASAYHGALLAPWPNRIPGGRWTWLGEPLQLPVNDPESGAALHGLVHDVEFAVDEATSDRVRLSHHLVAGTGFPFPLRLEAEYRLSGTGLACSLTAVNVGTRAAPVGLGAHPYVDAPETVDLLALMVPARTAVELDGSGRRMPPHAVSNRDTNFRRPRELGRSRLDTAFTDLAADGDGRVRVVVSAPSARDIVLTLGPTCRWLMVFRADIEGAAVARRGLALEPMTCAPGELGGADVLQPGAALQLNWVRLFWSDVRRLVGRRRRGSGIGGLVVVLG